jgi:hypothetical protein
VDNYVNLVKLSVGTESVEGLQDWQDMTALRLPEGLPRHVTRMWPKREAEILAGGSIYWVIKGQIQCRQRILRMDEVLDPQIHRTHTATKRPFQGWRYLKPEDSPADLPAGRSTEEPLPLELSQALAEIGVI